MLSERLELGDEALDLAGGVACEVVGAGVVVEQRVRDVARLAGVVVSGVVSRRPVRPLGDEARRPLAGDALAPGAKVSWTHGVTIRARPTKIWPWLLQMGCRRAGWYSYDGVDNGGVASAPRIVPELQRAEVGDIFPMSPTAEDGFVVRAVEPERALVLGDPAGSATWALVLEPIDETSTRLVTRVRAAYDRFAIGLVIGLVLRPITSACGDGSCSTSSAHGASGTVMSRSCQSSDAF